MRTLPTRLGIAALLLTAPVWAHVVSMSTGEAKLNGSRLDYELRMPMYEVAHIKDPEPTLFASIHFRGGGAEARLLEHSCREEAGNLVCHGLYLFPQDVDVFDVECGFASITVPNHVHLFRAIRGDHADQAAFDGSFTTAEIRFRPLTRIENAMRQAVAGLRAAATGIAQALFLLALVAATQTRRELALAVGCFFAGQLAGCLILPHIGMVLSPRFVEAAVALTVAYVAVESLALPNAGQRWVVAGLAGLFHGAYFSMLIQTGEFDVAPVLAGVFVAEGALTLMLAGIAMLAAKVMRQGIRLQFQRAIASLLLIAGMGWFLLRLRS